MRQDITLWLSAFSGAPRIGVVLRWTDCFLFALGIVKDRQVYFAMNATMNLSTTPCFSLKTLKCSLRWSGERGLYKRYKSESREPISRRVQLFHEIIALGIRKLLEDSAGRRP